MDAATVQRAISTIAANFAEERPPLGTYQIQSLGAARGVGRRIPAQRSKEFRKRIWDHFFHADCRGAGR
jgi:hypothetical protein